MLRTLLSFLTLCFFVSSAWSQGYFSVSEEEFGQNRLQLRELKWKTVYSNNFEFNYYRGGEELTNTAAKMAEKEYRKITEILGYTPFTTMKIFIYRSPSHLKESNIGLTSPVTYDGGILNLSRSRIEIAYDGNDEVFREELIKEISRLFVYDMLFGGSLKEVLQSTILLTVPEWYMSGIANYIAYDHKIPERKQVLKEAIDRNADKKINQIKGEDAALIGESIWYYIAQRYGEDNISNILNLTRIIRAEQSSITSTLGVSFQKFTKDWRAFYSGTLPNTTEGNLNSETSVVKETTTNKTQKLVGLVDGQIDTEFYEFKEENVKKASETPSTIIVGGTSTFNSNNLKRGAEKFSLSSPKTYQNLLINNELEPEIINDPVRRLGLNLGLSLNDLLENNIFKINVLVTPSLVNHDINLSYMNYTRRLDWGIKFERRSINFEEINDRNSYLFRPFEIRLGESTNIPLNRQIALHRISGKFAYPFSRTLRAELIPSIFVNNDIDLVNLSRAILQDTYSGIRADMVYDNTSTIFKNSIQGTQGRLSFQRNMNFGNAMNNFDRIHVDLRHYQNLVKGITLAGRFNYGRSMGNNPQYTFLGGVENWLNRSIQSTFGDNAGIPFDLRNIAFFNFAGDLRGFEFAKLFGSNHLLTNLELRMAVANYFPSNAITSGFLKNLEFVLFNDIGTAWNGNSGPFSKQNSLNTEEVGGGTNPFYAVVTNFKNPFLIGYGAGVRTAILGMTVKIDYGFGLEDNEVSPGRIYVSLGKGF